MGRGERYAYSLRSFRKLESAVTFLHLYTPLKLLDVVISGFWGYSECLINCFVKQKQEFFLFPSFIKLQYSAATSQLNYSLAHYHTASACVSNSKLQLLYSSTLLK